MPGSEKTLWDRMTTEFYQPIFSVIAENANVEQKEVFVKVIEDTLKDIGENGMDKKALKPESIIMSSVTERRISEVIQKGLMYGLQIMDSWLYDDEKPFIHIEALDTF